MIWGKVVGIGHILIREIGRVAWIVVESGAFKILVDIWDWFDIKIIGIKIVSFHVLVLCISLALLIFF